MRKATEIYEDRDDDDAPKFGDAECVGTPEYLSPEVILQARFLHIFFVQNSKGFVLKYFPRGKIKTIRRQKSIFLSNSTILKIVKTKPTNMG